MNKIVPTLLIILLFPIFASAHGLVPEITVPAGQVPGDRGYVFKNLSRWFEINIFTPSTKAKQQKYLRLSNERASEIYSLAALGAKASDLRRSVSAYQAAVSRAEDMAEKIIFLDGAQIGLATATENETAIQEKVFGEILEHATKENYQPITEALGFARTANEEIYNYMVTKYQQTDTDVERDKAILGREISFAERAEGFSPDLLSSQQKKKFEDSIAAAKKYQKTGLNWEGYLRLKKAKDLIYSALIRARATQ